jgi:hypothetical protein
VPGRQRASAGSERPASAARRSRPSCAEQPTSGRRDSRSQGVTSPSLSRPITLRARACDLRGADPGDPRARRRARLRWITGSIPPERWAHAHLVPALVPGPPLAFSKRRGLRRRGGFWREGVSPLTPRPDAGSRAPHPASSRAQTWTGNSENFRQGDLSILQVGDVLRIQSGHNSGYHWRVGLTGRDPFSHAGFLSRARWPDCGQAQGLEGLLRNRPTS